MENKSLMKEIMRFLMGRKLEMTQIFSEEGTAAPVTKIQAGPCTVVQVKNTEKDGYTAVQFGYGEKKEKNIAKPQKGHMKGLKNFRYLKEMRVKDEKQELKRGDIINVSSFSEGDKIQVTANSKGKGFQGVVKRYGFHGSLATHGHKDQIRMPGSIGATGPAHVFKGIRMGGHMGNEQVTVKNLEIIKVDIENNIIYIKGAVPGARNGLVIIQGEGELQTVESPKVNEVESTTMSDEKSEIQETEKVESEKLKVESTTTDDETKKSAQADAKAGKTEKLEATDEEKVTESSSAKATEDKKKE